MTQKGSKPPSKAERKAERQKANWDKSDQWYQEKRRPTDPLQKVREKLKKSGDRKVRYLGFISDSYPPTSARILTEPEDPVHVAEIAIWCKIGSYDKRLKVAEEYGQAKIEYAVRDRVVGGSQQNSALMVKMLLELQGKTVTQVRKEANEELPAGTQLMPDRALEGLTTEELEEQLKENQDAESDQQGTEGIGSEGADEAAAG